MSSCRKFPKKKNAKMRAHLISSHHRHTCK
jgi:hypothetical protein